MLASLQHPNIVKVVAAGHEGQLPWLAMELVEGCDLGSLVQDWQSHPPGNRWALVERYFRDLCEALEYLHGQGLVHRDIKPSNVLVSRDGTVKLTDFGGVKGPEAFSTQLTAVGRIVGTVAYMAPELVTTETIHPRQDLYSLGAVLYVMMTGRPPIQADSIAAYLARHMVASPELPTVFQPDAPRHLERVCMALLRKEPARRLASPRAALDMLERDAPPALPTLYERDEILGSITSAALEPGRSALFVLAGPMGSGKSALLAELASNLRDSRPHLSSFRHDRHAALEGCKDLLRPCPGSPQSVTGHPPPEERLPLPVLLDDADRLSHEEMEELKAAITRFLDMGQRPLVVVVTASAGELHSVLSEWGQMEPELAELAPLSRSASVALFADHGLSRGVAAVLARRLFSEVDEERSSSQATQPGANPATGHWRETASAASRKAGSFISAHLVKAGLARAMFKPYPGLLLEQIGALEQAGCFVRDSSGDLRLARSMEELRKEALPVPQRVRAELLSLVDALDSEARSLLEALAVAGEFCSIPVLTGVCAPDWELCSRLLDELVVLGLVERDGGGSFRLAARPLQRVIYDEIQHDRRQELHRSFARVYDGLFKRRRHVLPVITRHLMLGALPADAYPLLLQAAEHALDRGEDLLAQDFLRQAGSIRSRALHGLDPAGRDSRVARYHQVKGELLLIKGDHQAAAESMEQVLQAALRLEDSRLRGIAIAGLGACHLEGGDLDAGRSCLEQAHSLLSPRDRMWPPTTERLAILRSMYGSSRGARVLWQSLLLHARQVGDLVQEGRALTGLGQVASNQGDVSSAHDYLEKAEMLLRKGNGVESLLETLVLLADLAMACGRYREALDRANEACQLARAGSTAELRILARGTAAYAALLLGHHELANEMASESLKTARAVLWNPGFHPEQVFGKVPGGIEGRQLRWNNVQWARNACLGRVLLDLGRGKEVLENFPPPLKEDCQPRSDQVASLALLRARALAIVDPVAAFELADWAISGPMCLPRHTSVALLLDATRALAESGRPLEAGAAFGRAMDWLEGSGFLGLKLEAALMAARLSTELDMPLHVDGPDPRALVAEFSAGLFGTDRDAFLARPDLARFVG